MLSYWGQLWESASQGSGPAASVRKVNVNLPEGDSSEESDSEDDKADQQQPVIVTVEVPAVAYREHTLEIRSSGDSSYEALLQAIDLAQTSVASFCIRTGVTRVEPSDKELDELWSTLGFQSAHLSNQGKGQFFTDVAMTVACHLCDNREHDWKPHLRILCLLEYLLCRGGLRRHIAGLVLEKDRTMEHVQHLSAEVIPCKEKALRVMGLSKYAAVVPQDDQIGIGSDGGMFVKDKSQQPLGQETDAIAQASSETSSSMSQEAQSSAFNDDNPAHSAEASLVLKPSDCHAAATDEASSCAVFSPSAAPEVFAACAEDSAILPDAANDVMEDTLPIPDPAVQDGLTPEPKDAEHADNECLPGEAAPLNDVQDAAAESSAASASHDLTDFFDGFFDKATHHTFDTRDDDEVTNSGSAGDSVDELSSALQSSPDSCSADAQPLGVNWPNYELPPSAFTAPEDLSAKVEFHELLLHLPECSEVDHQRVSVEPPALPASRTLAELWQPPSKADDPHTSTARRVVPEIPQGIEDTIPEPIDPFAHLLTI